MTDDYVAVLEGKGFNPIHSRLIVRDARALHETETAMPDSPPAVKSKTNLPGPFVPAGGPHHEGPSVSFMPAHEEN